MTTVALLRVVNPTCNASFIPSLAHTNRIITRQTTQELQKNIEDSAIATAFYNIGAYFQKTWQHVHSWWQLRTTISQLTSMSDKGAALKIATAKNLSSVVSSILHRDVSIEVRGKALLEAAQEGKLEIVETILSKTKRWRESGWFDATDSNYPGFAFVEAVKRGHKEIARALLTSHGYRIVRPVFLCQAYAIAASKDDQASMDEIAAFIRPQITPHSVSLSFINNGIFAQNSESIIKGMKVCALAYANRMAEMVAFLEEEGDAIPDIILSYAQAFAEGSLAETIKAFLVTREKRRLDSKIESIQTKHVQVVYSDSKELKALGERITALPLEDSRAYLLKLRLRLKDALIPAIQEFEDTYIPSASHEEPCHPK